MQIDGGERRPERHLRGRSLEMHGIGETGPVPSPDQTDTAGGMTERLPERVGAVPLRRIPGVEPDDVRRQTIAVMIRRALLRHDSSLTSASGREQPGLTRLTAITLEQTPSLKTSPLRSSVGVSAVMIRGLQRLRDQRSKRWIQMRCISIRVLCFALLFCLRMRLSCWRLYFCCLFCRNLFCSHCLLLSLHAVIRQDRPIPVVGERTVLPTFALYDTNFQQRVSYEGESSIALARDAL